MKTIKIIAKSEFGNKKIIEHYDNMKQPEKINLFLMGIRIEKIIEGLQIRFPNKYDKLFESMNLNNNEKFKQGLKELIIDFEKEGVKEHTDYEIEVMK